MEILVQKGPDDHIFYRCLDCGFGYCKTHESELHKKKHTQRVGNESL